MRIPCDECFKWDVFPHGDFFSFWSPSLATDDSDNAFALRQTQSGQDAPRVFNRLVGTDDGHCGTKDLLKNIMWNTMIVKGFPEGLSTLDTLTTLPSRLREDQFGWNNECVVVIFPEESFEER